MKNEEAKECMQTECTYPDCNKVCDKAAYRDNLMHSAQLQKELLEKLTEREMGN